MDAIIKKLLDELEIIFTVHEEEVELLELQNKDYVSICNLIEVLEKSKKDFIHGFLELTGERRENFDKLINRVIPQTEIKQDIFKQIYIFNLLSSISGQDSTECIIQKNSCFESLDLLKNRLKDYLKTIDYKENIEKINSLNGYLERIIKIGSSFDMGTLSESIEDIDDFYKMLAEVNLTSEEKGTLLEFVIRENIRLYGQNISKDGTKSIQIDNDSLEKLELLLENVDDKELRSEEVDSVFNKAKLLLYQDFDYIGQLSNTEKEALENKILNNQKDKSLRKSGFVKKHSKGDIDSIIHEATYEMYYYLTLLKYSGKSNDTRLRRKFALRIKEVIDDLEAVIKDTKDSINTLEVVDEGIERHLLFLMRSDDLSYFEEDLYQDNDNWKYDNTVYYEARDLLNNIKENDDIDYHQIRDVWKNLYQFGARFVSNNSVGMFYIPIDNDNLLMLGMKTVTGDFGFQDMNSRVGLCEEQIVEIINKVKSGKITVGEIEKINEEEKKLLAMLSFLEINGDESFTDEEKCVGRAR